MNIRLRLLFAFTFIATASQAQTNVGIGTNAPNASSVLELSSTNTGLLIPRMSLADRDNIINPATSLLIYQTDNTPGLYINSGIPSAPNWNILHSGIIGITNGGTGATSAAAARINFGLGSLATLSAIGSGEITNASIVDADISTAAAISGSKISGNISGNAGNITGTVALANGGTGGTTAVAARTNLGLGSLATLNSISSAEITNGTITNDDISTTAAISGSKISGNISGNAANVTGTVAIANGGTGATTAAAALNALLPSQSGNGTKVFTTDGSSATWQVPAGGATPTVYSIISTKITVSNANFANALSVTLLPNKIYQIDGSLIMNRPSSSSTSAPVTFRYNYSGTGTTDLGVEMLGNIIAGTAFNSGGTFDYAASGNTVSAGLLPTGRTLGGYIRSGNGGVLTLQVGRTSANTTLDFEIREGSYLILRPLN